MNKVWAVALVSLLLCVTAGYAQKKKGEPATRSVSGSVTSDDGKPVVGAVVQLKDTKSKQIRSFYTQEHGAYYFHGLSPDIDYELMASFEGASSPTRTLSIYDSRRDPVIDLKLNPKK